ncbi:leucine-rich repeat receptor protein kinase HPCA1-like [Salvia miltiorrhiza]|uniref:leucine-rich repeat receptor protein kinase HPCA1-like n=1 Tax=Salvia miltiorrhiza TaxID=226208 RepID=UPI0025ACEB1B|nr:leucine-rich repeat receptor protein kinase HPCA1-like [Salvia miltiorrhiza]
MAATTRLLFCCPIFFSLYIQVIYAATNAQDAAALRSLKDEWTNTPPSWDASGDPCSSWDGVVCDNSSRVTSLELSSMGLTGKMSGDIGQLSELLSLDLSNNLGLTGIISPQLGNLKKLAILMLSGCSFTGSIPSEIGNLPELNFLALNFNNLNGEIPPSLGQLSKLYWLDLSDNRLTGEIPFASSINPDPGLNQLKNAKHFHFSNNLLSGPIPGQLFGPDMSLIHLLLDGNQFSEEIPASIASVQTFEVIRLDRNRLTGAVPSLSNLTSLINLHLSNNQLSGSLPDLTGLNFLTYLDLSNNSFDQSEAPAWLSTLQSLTTLVMEQGALNGTVPQGILSLPQIQQLSLKNNAFTELNLSTSVGDKLQLIDLQNNGIAKLELGSEFKNTLVLLGNPICANNPNQVYCQIQQELKPYSTSLALCGPATCDSNELKLSPGSCGCAYPYEGVLYFVAPQSMDLSNATLFRALESTLAMSLSLAPGSVSLQNLSFSNDSYLQMQLEVFPTDAKYFSRSEIRTISSALARRTYKAPSELGLYYFKPSEYIFDDEHRKALSTGSIAGIVAGSAVLVLLLAVLAVYAVRQKRRAEQAMSLSNPFASWTTGGTEAGGAPQLKGARWFSYNELKKCTNNFSESNQIGSGGYGKVYKGVLSGGVVVAVKRSERGSTQGGTEFKTEIELLSRVHHKNLVGLVGFCFEQGEQMLVYEFMANGTLRESLSGKSGIQLDWRRRIKVALGSARGLAYLHELAHPPIIHRDVKSTNILLDENLTAKVADFGLSKLVCDVSKGHVSTQVKGTLGYLDPEYYMTQQLTEKSDVYSLGVVMLELIIGRQPIEKGKYIVREVRIAMDKNNEAHYGLVDKIDPAIRNGGDQLVGFPTFLELAMQCVEEAASDRPSTSEIVKALEALLQAEGMNTSTSSTSASSSASSSGTEFGHGNSVRQHPYDESITRKNGEDSEAFGFDNRYALVSIVEK